MVTYVSFLGIFHEKYKPDVAKKLYTSLREEAGFGVPSKFDPIMDEIIEFYESKKITTRKNPKPIRPIWYPQPNKHFEALQSGRLGYDEVCKIFYWYHCIHPKYCEQIETDVFGDTLENLVEQEGKRTKPGRKRSGRVTKPAKPVLPPKPRSRPYTHPVYAAKTTVEEAERDIAQGGDSSLWLSPYNHFSIPLFGRDKEIEILNAFMKDDAPFLITYVIAPSGAGKTRLVSQWMRKFVDDPTDTEGDEPKVEGWDAGLVESRDDSVWKDWQPHCDTLIVIDYTYNYDAVIKAITDKGKESHGKRIRLLILDHIKPQKMGDDISYHMADDTNVRTGIKSVLVRSEYATITLSPDEHSRDLLSSVIARTASLFSDRPYDVNDAIIRDATDHLLSGGQTGGAIQDQQSDQSDENNASANALRHPLFAALMGQSIGLNPDGDVARLKRRNLVEQYFEPPQRIPWKEDENNEFHETLGSWIGCYVSVATLLRGTELDRIRAYLPKSFGETLKKPQAVTTIKQIAGRLVSQDVKDILKPFEPDILGETFFLKFLMDHEDDDEALCAFYQMLARFTDEKKEREAVGNFLETLQRLTRNLIYDDQSNEFIRNAWRHLGLFLDPTKFHENSLMRKAVSIALTDVIAQCYKAGIENSIIERFARHINLADLDNLSRNVLPGIWLFAVYICFDWILQTDFLTDEVRNLFREILERFTASVKNGATVLMIASYLGNANVVKVLLENKANPNKSTTNDGTTALMLASAKEHADIVKLLLANEADPNKQANDSGRTALMFASQNGNVDVVKLLLEFKADPNKQATDNGATALTIAASTGCIDVVKLLLENEADPNLPKEDGFTALILSAGNDYLEITSLLISSPRIKIDHQGANSATALIYAALFNKTEGVKTLLLAGANPLIKANDGSIAADFALLYAKNLELHDLLKQAEADWIAKHGEPL